MTTILNYEGFEKYLVEWGEHPIGDGVYYRFRFENNYGASIVKHHFSYGYWNDQWELAVLKWEDDDWDLDYETEITDDVIGWLTDEEVRELLGRIQKLKSVTNT